MAEEEAQKGEAEQGEAEQGEAEQGEAEQGEAEVRVWLVERTYTDKGLVTLVYATPDGERAITRQRSEQLLARTEVTAATDVEPSSLEPVAAEEVARYAAEADRMRESHEPGDVV